MIKARDAIMAAQRVMSARTPSLRPDGWWGSFTQQAYAASSPSDQSIVRTILKAASISVDEAYKETRDVRKAEKSTGVISPEYAMSLAIRGDDGSSIFSKLPTEARRLAERAHKAGITGSSLVNFLANVKVESNFVPQREDHRYGYTAAKKNSNLSRLTEAELKELVRKGPQAFFGVMYREGTPLGKKLGNTQAGDGGRFYGRGLKQITGRWNYTEFSKAYPKWNALENPDVLIESWDASADAAIWFWKTFVMKGGQDKSIVAASKIVNGGTNGLDARIAAAQEYTRALA